MTTIADRLRIDAVAAMDQVARSLRARVAEDLRRRGVVIAMSGGVDSSVCAGLAVRAFGPKRVLGLMLPEGESSADDLTLGRSWAKTLGIQHIVEDIGPALAGCGAYRRRDAAIRELVPEYGDGWRCKVSLGERRALAGGLNVTFLTVQGPDGHERRIRLPGHIYRAIVAATNFKQRVRKIMDYYHADRLHYAVVGTPNRLEYDQGFFVKGGDGLADVKPIAHLYKTQVYQLAEALGVPSEITSRVPTTGTYSMDQTQEEFYFSLPLRSLDIALYGYNHGLPVALPAAELGLSPDEVEHIYRDIATKRSTTRYLHLGAMLLEPVEDVG